MKLTANSAIYREKGERNPHVASLEYFHRSGFDGMDVNLGGALLPGHYLSREDWERGIREVAETAGKLQMEISQSHLPFYNFADPGCPELEEKNRMFARMIRASGMLGVKWAVFHPGNAIDSVAGVKESKRRSVEFLKPYLELAEKYKVGIAVENLFVPHKLDKAYRYCFRVEEVCDLVDSLEGNVGVCWDFGHANLIGDDQGDCLRMVGNRLKAVHVHDNNGLHDDHQIPFTHYCTVEWEKVLTVLKEIGYRGNFNFEVMNSRMPKEAAEGFGIYLEQLGRAMMKMIK